MHRDSLLCLLKHRQPKTRRHGKEEGQAEKLTQDRYQNEQKAPNKKMLTGFQSRKTVLKKKQLGSKDRGVAQWGVIT
jgi:hypothetical protein